MYLNVISAFESLRKGAIEMYYYYYKTQNLPELPVEDPVVTIMLNSSSVANVTLNKDRCNVERVTLFSFISQYSLHEVTVTHNAFLIQK